MPPPVAAPAAPAAAPASSPSATPAAAPSAAKTSTTGAPPNPVGGGTPPPRQTAGQESAPAVPAKVKWKDKVDGKEVEFEATEDEMRAAFRHRRAADSRFEESARLRREAAEEARRTQETMSRLADRNEWLRALREANPDMGPEEFSDFLGGQLQAMLHESEQMADPATRERKRLEAEVQKLRQAEQQRLQQQREQERASAVEQESDRWASLFTEALKATPLPANDITMSLMAQAQMTARQRGIELTPEKLAGATVKAAHGMIEAILAHEGTTDDALLDAFPALTKRIHRAIVARYKARQAGGSTGDVTRRVAPAPTEPTKPAGPRVVSSREESEAYGLRKGLRTI